MAEAEQELLDAQAALAEAIATASSVPTSSTTPETTTSTTIVPSARIERVQQAEDDLAQAAEGITNATPLAEATAEYNSAAFALQIVWLQLLADASCFTDEQHAEAVKQVTEYTTTLQSELQLVGYYDGEIDGIYGPETVDAVKRLQVDSGLRETGFVDRATAQALDQKLEEVGQQAAATEMTYTASVQTVLTLTGFWTGPIDGKWTDELTAALKAFQTELGVKPTGEVDAATLAAFEQALAELESLATATTTTTTTPTDDDCPADDNDRPADDRRGDRPTDRPPASYDDGLTPPADRRSGGRVVERRETPQDRRIELGDRGMDRQHFCENVVGRARVHQGADDLHDLITGNAEHRSAEESFRFIVHQDADEPVCFAVERGPRDGGHRKRRLAHLAS